MEVVKLLADDRLDEALDMLFESVPLKDDRSEIVMVLSRRLSQSKRDRQNDIVSPVEDSRTRSRIARDIRDFVVDFNEETEPPLTPAEDPHSPTDLGYTGDITYSGSRCARQQAVVVKGTYAEVYERCVNALTGAGMDIGTKDPERGTISGSSGMGLLSMGIVGYLFLTPKDRYRTLVTVIVDSRLRTTLLDYGTNKKKLREIVALIN